MNDDHDPHFHVSLVGLDNAWTEKQFWAALRRATMLHSPGYDPNATPAWVSEGVGEEFL